MSRKLFPPPSEESENSFFADQAPLADRMRPCSLEEVLGQSHLLSKGKFLREMIESDEISSMIFWGPPGVGKTTLAKVIAHTTESYFVSISAVLAGIKDVKKIVEEARDQINSFKTRTILFVDEIHRFNKAQQDAFLPHVEKGVLILIGATTENPSFEVIAPLLSRTRVLKLNPLEKHHVIDILKRALVDSERGLGSLQVQSDAKILEHIAIWANGDARMALNGLEVSVHLAKRQSSEITVLSQELVSEALQERTLLYDKNGEEHFNLISALHKSLRNSDVDAALYWLARMLEAGEDPMYVVRRMVRFASEDIGMADPAALGYSIDTMQAVHFLGLPEGNLSLAQLAVYLAQAPKSNAIYEAYVCAQKDVKRNANEPVPLHLRNAPTNLMKKLGYGRGYKYAHREEEGVADMECLPENLQGKRYYVPRNAGFEESIKSRLEKIKEIKTEKQKLRQASKTKKS